MLDGQVQPRRAQLHGILEIIFWKRHVLCAVQGPQENGGKDFVPLVVLVVFRDAVIELFCRFIFLGYIVFQGHATRNVENLPRRVFELFKILVGSVQNFKNDGGMIDLFIYC